jgi:hypothetical protein
VSVELGCQVARQAAGFHELQDRAGDLDVGNSAWIGVHSSTVTGLTIAQVDVWGMNRKL